MQTVHEQLRQYVLDNFLFGQDHVNLSDQDSFLKKGIIDSTGVLELISFLETTYTIRIADEELVPENLDSVNNLVRFVEGKLARTAVRE